MITETERADFFTPDFGAVPPSPVSERIQKQPECRLLWAILQNGIEEYMKYAFATSRRGKRLFREAEEWIMQDDHTWLCSFVNICLVLGLEPEYLRTGLQRWHAAREVTTFKQAA